MRLYNYNKRKRKREMIPVTREARYSRDKYIAVNIDAIIQTYTLLENSQKIEFICTIFYSVLY